MYRAVSRAQTNRSTSAWESRRPLSGELVGFVTFDGYSMHVAPLPVIVVQGVVLHDPVAHIVTVPVSHLTRQVKRSSSQWLYKNASRAWLSFLRIPLILSVNGRFTYNARRPDSG